MLTVTEGIASRRSNVKAIVLTAIMASTSRTFALPFTLGLKGWIHSVMVLHDAVVEELIFSSFASFLDSSIAAASVALEAS